MRSVMAFLVFLSPQMAAAECICLNRGVEVKEGKTACIKTAKGPELALCEKNLNVTNWKFLGEGCLVVGVETDANMRAVGGNASSAIDRVTAVYFRKEVRPDL